MRHTFLPVAIVMLLVCGQPQADEVPMATPRQPVLLVTDDPDSFNHRYVQYALAPPGTSGKKHLASVVDLTLVRTKDIDKASLAKYRVIYLVDVKKLDDDVSKVLKARVKKGAGLCIFLGGNADRRFYRNQFDKDGGGLLPVLIDVAKKLPPRDKDQSSDIVISDHPAFRVLRDERLPFKSTTFIHQYFHINNEWKHRRDSLRIICKLRNDAPLIVEQRFGRGRVVTFLTAPDPKWTNWMVNVSWVVMLNELQSYLATGKPPLASGSTKESAKE